MDRAAETDRIESGSDLREAEDADRSPKQGHDPILQHEMAEGLDALNRPILSLFLSGLSAGLDIGFSLFLMAVALSHPEGALPGAVERLLVANLYSVGFLFVILGRPELFTEQTTLAVLPTLGGLASVGALLRLWGVVWSANILGAAALQPSWRPGSARRSEISTRVHVAIWPTGSPTTPRTAIFLSAVLADWLMGLLSWLVAAGRDTISRVVLVWLVTTSIGYAGLHHVILGSVEVFAGAFSGQGIGPGEVGRSPIWATLGNTLGGVEFVAILKYGHARPEARKDSSEAR